MTRRLPVHSKKPLWQLIHEDLLTRLNDGEFPERFPTDFELVDEYEVSRHTVREAIRRLEGDGLLTRHRGKGTFVNQEAIDQPLTSTIYSLFRSLESLGLAYPVQHRRLPRWLTRTLSRQRISRLECSYFLQKATQLHLEA